MTNGRLLSEHDMARYGLFECYLDEFVSVFIDDILVYSKAGLRVDIDKCDFEAKSVKYLGFIVEAST